jgi:hypothetical protein
MVRSCLIEVLYFSRDWGTGVEAMYGRLLIFLEALSGFAAKWQSEERFLKTPKKLALLSH